MTRSCKICGLRKHQVQGITLHMFPKDPDRLSSWLCELNLYDVGDTTTIRICSRHFSEHQFETTVSRSGQLFRKLRNDACPDVFYNEREVPEKTIHRSLGTQTDITVPPYAECIGGLDDYINEHQARKRKCYFSRADMRIESLDDLQNCAGLPSTPTDVLMVDEHVRVEMIESFSDSPTVSSTNSFLSTSYIEAVNETWNGDEILSTGAVKTVGDTDDERTSNDYDEILRSLNESPSQSKCTAGYSVADEDVSVKVSATKQHPFSHLGPTLSVQYITDDEVHYLTGFSETQFEYVLCLAEKKNGRNWPCHMLLRNQLLLSLIKLRHNFDYKFLSILFRVSRQTACKIFRFWIELLDEAVNAIDFWELGVKADDLYRVVLDCSEFVIEKPTRILQQQITWSSYKHRNTFKVLIGIDENGTVIFVSPLYGGSASDDTIVQKSGILDLLKPGDHVLADRGFETNDAMAQKGIILNKPPSKKGDQLSEVDVAHTRAIASRRVEVERVIGLAKDNRILTQRINHCLFPLADKIVNVIFKLTNFKKPICKGTE